MDIVTSLKNVRRQVATFSLAALVASFFAIGVAQAQTFPDVQPGDWYYSYVEDLVAMGVVNGSMSEYRPGDNVNRAEMAKLVVEGFDIPLVETAGLQTFNDVPEGEWFHVYVETAYSNGIVGGYLDDNGDPSGFFGPADPLTREQSAKMLVLGAPMTVNTNCGPSFPDVTTNMWSYNFVETLYVNSVVDGYPDGTFGPALNINRAEIAKMVSNAMNPVLRPCGGFSVASAEAMSATSVEACFTQEYGDGAMDMANYMIEDQNGNALAVTDVAASSDPMCVDLTTDAQDSTKVYDLMVDNVMSSTGEELLGKTATFDGFSVAEAGALTAMVSGSTPAEANIPKNASNVTYSIFSFEASDEEAVNLEQLLITRQGLGLPGDFDEVKVFVDGVRRGSGKTINTSTNTATFSFVANPIMIPAGSSVNVSVTGDMAGAENSINKLCIASSDDVVATGAESGAALAVAGSFALCGNEMTTTSASVGAIEYEIDDYTGDINIGEMDVSLARLQLDVSSTEDIELERVTFEQTGSADEDAFANMMLYVSGTPLDADVMWVGDYLTFDISEDPFFIERGNTRTFELRGDVVGGLGDDVLFEIDEEDDITGVGMVYGYPVNVSETGTPPAIASRDIVGGNLAFALSSNNPTVGDVMAGRNDHPFLAFNMSTGGDGVTIDEFDIDLVATAPGLYEDIADVKIWKRDKETGDLVSIGVGPVEPTAGGPGTQTLTFNDDIVQQAGMTVEYVLTADVENSADDTSVFRFEFDTATVDAEYLSDNQTVQAADISGGTLVGKDQTVNDPTLDITLGVVPPDQNVVGGQLDLETASWNLAASSASDIKLTSLVVTCAYTDTVVDGDECSDVFSSARLYNKVGSTYTLLKGGEDFTGEQAEFNSLNFTIPAGQTVNLVLMTNTSTAADATDEADFSIDAVGDFIAEDEEFNNLDAGQKTTDALARNITFVGSGDLSVRLSGSSPTDDALSGGASDQHVTTLRLNADENEDIIIQKLRLTNYGVDDPVGSVMLYDGATLLGTSIFSGGEAEFTSLNVTVPADGQKLLQVLVDTNEISSSAATSGDDIEISIDDVTYTPATETFEADDVDIKAVGASSGELVTMTDNFAGGAPGSPGNFVVYNTLPSFVRTGSSPTSGGGTNQSMLQFDFNVEGPNGETGTMTELVVSFAGTCADPTDFRLFRGNTEIGDSAGDLTLTTAEFTNGIGEEVASGDTSTLSIHADTTGCLVDQTLVVNVDSIDYDDGDAVYTATSANNYLFFDSSPFPLAGHQFTF